MLPWHLQRLSTHHPPVDPRAHRLAHSIGLLCGRSHSLADYSWNWGKVGLPHVSAQFHFPCLRTVVRRRAGTPGCQGCSSGSRRIVLDGNAPPPSNSVCGRSILIVATPFCAAVGELRPPGRNVRRGLHRACGRRGRHLRLRCRRRLVLPRAPWRYVSHRSFSGQPVFGPVAPASSHPIVFDSTGASP